MPNHELNNSDGHLTQTFPKGNVWSCGHCFVPNLPDAEICRSCRKQKTTIDEVNDKNSRQSHVFCHYFLGFIEFVALVTLINVSATVLSAVVALIVVWWSGLIFMTLHVSPSNGFTYTQKVAEDFINHQVPEHRKWVSVIYRFFYWPIFFQKTIAILFIILAIVWLLYSWK